VPIYCYLCPICFLNVSSIALHGALLRLGYHDRTFSTFATSIVQEMYTFVSLLPKAADDRSEFRDQ